MTVPDGWKELPLGEVLERVFDYRGKSVPKAMSGIPLITARNVREGFLDFTTQEYIDAACYDSWASRGMPCGGDILFTTEAPLGNVCLFPAEGKYVVGQRTVTLRPVKTVSSEFLINYFLSELGKRRIDIRSTGSTAKGIKSSELKKVLILLPTFPEQKAIAAVLSSWDRAIEKIEALIEAKERRKAGLMQRLLTGKVRFGGFGPGASEGCPDGWLVCRIEDVCKRVSRKNSIGELRVLTASGEHGLVDQREYFNRSVAGESLANYYLLKKGEFAYNRSSMKGYPYGAIKRLDQYDAGILSTLYICFAVREGKANLDFMRHFFDSSILNKGLRGIVQVGARAHGLLNVSVGDFMRLTICIPKMKEQERIAAALNAVSQELDGDRNHLALLKEQKKGLMQQLLTGKVRI
ncbi:MAG: restriction endonuclease subunit S [Pseudodesulfovibrio sp.]|uniref:restriction endonuclease subunit S n=1 Tax=Pseudodesulfovibrio sp. TaxID=2035812 RepID=UPI003D0A1E38